jgi:hypothetical protein
VLTRAVGVFEALHATATITRAQISQRRRLAFVIFVTLIANQPSLIATVLPFAIDVSTAPLQTAVGEGVTGKSRLAIGGGDARHAAVTDRLAAG